MLPNTDISSSSWHGKKNVAISKQSNIHLESYFFPLSECNSNIHSLFCSSTSHENNIRLFECYMFYVHPSFPAKNSCLLLLKRTLVRVLRVNRNMKAVGWKKKQNNELKDTKTKPVWGKLWRWEVIGCGFITTSGQSIELLIKKNID